MQIATAQTLNRLTRITVAIELLAEKAVRRIARECAAARTNGSDKTAVARIHTLAVGAAKASLEAVTPGAVPAKDLHNRINALCVQAGIARWDGAALRPVW